ncbi:hypothetical protein R4B61_07615 (plasmid) [Fructilactobacillus vespulae]|uniref:hypothetical protein n=1 Tax=Fructilactobacillus vespulae TaxID=1249630 RepID=UPI0039B46F9A
MSALEAIIVKRIPKETKQRLKIIAQENGYPNLSSFLRSQLKMIAQIGKPIEKSDPIQLQLNEINRRLDNVNLALNKNNQIYAEDKNILKDKLGE